MEVAWQDFLARGATDPMNSTSDLFPNPVRRHLRLSTAAIAGVLASLLLVGCSGALVKHSYDAAGKPVLTKRKAQHENYDYVHHFSRTVYLPASKRLNAPLAAAGAQAADDPLHALRGFRCPEGRLSDDQATLIVELGRGPDYVRPTFRSREGENVTEWLYMKDHVMAQFVAGELVYRGALSGRETMLLKHGYPNHSMSVRENIGPERENFIYRNWSGSRLEVYGLSDDRLAVSVE